MDIKLEKIADHKTIQAGKLEVAETKTLIEPGQHFSRYHLVSKKNERVIAKWASRQNTRGRVTFSAEQVEELRAKLTQFFARKNDTAHQGTTAKATAAMLDEQVNFSFATQVEQLGNALQKSVKIEEMPANATAKQLVADFDATMNLK